MSEQNEIDGNCLYATGDADTRAWFCRQWAIWPERADQRFTTNMSFLYGGVVAFRAEHGRDPKMSDQFAANINWYDRHP